MTLLSARMEAILASPRRRRRLGWSAAAVLVAGAAAVGVVLMPGSPKPVPQHLRKGAWVDNDKPVRLTPAMRDGIDATLAKFVPAAVTGRDPALAWKLAGPDLRAGTTRQDWIRGEGPVLKFPWRGDTAGLKGWRPFFTYRNRVGFDVMLLPTKRSKKGAIVVSVDLVRRGSKWLVNYWNVTATLSAPGEPVYVTGVPDYGPQGMTAKGFYEHPRYDKSRLGAEWFLLPVGLLAALVLGGGAYGLRKRRRV